MAANHPNSHNPLSAPLLHAFEAVRQFLQSQSDHFPESSLIFEQELDELQIIHASPHKNSNDSSAQELDESYLLDALHHYSEYKRSLRAQSANKSLDKHLKLQQLRDQIISDIAENSSENCQPIPLNVQQTVLQKQAANVLAVAPLYVQNSLQNYCIAAAADKTVSIFTVPSAKDEENSATETVQFEEKALATYTTTAPILCLSANPVHSGVAAAGLMNGTVIILQFSAENHSLSLRAHYSDISDTKYILNCVFSDDGAQLLASSHSGTVKVFDFEPDNGVERLQPRLISVYDRAVEAIAWLSADLFYCAQHEDNFLRLISTKLQNSVGTPQEISFNMNELQDNHVSFTVLAVSISPCKKLVAAATDRSRIIVFPVHSSQQLRNFYTVPIDSYSSPRLIWSKNSRFLYCSGADKLIYALDIITGLTVPAQLKGHSEKIKGIAWHTGAKGILSCGFDKTIRLWQGKGSGQTNQLQPEQ
jgi:WD40 repeat protein